MTRKERYDFVIHYFEEHLPNATTELHYKNAYQLLVAVILSAQCTDKRVNEVTPAFFKKFPHPKALAKANFDDVFPLIKSISYPNNKTKHLIGMAKMLVEKYNGQVPNNVDDLMELPGVGRKTAHVITSVIGNQPTMAVDTHVFRVANRIGLVKATTPLAVEKQLVQNIPAEKIHLAHHWFILHGRYVCTARNPKCVECGLKPVCEYYKNVYQEVKQSKSKSKKSTQKINYENISSRR